MKLKISDDAYYGEKLHFEEGAFPKLKLLRLCRLSKLCFSVIEEGALCYLGEFDIGPCPQLKELSFGFQHLRNLKQVYIREMPTKFFMFQNFQSLQSTGANVRLFLSIHGKRWWPRLEEVTEILENMEGKS